MSASDTLRGIAEHPVGVMNTLEQRRAYLLWAADAADALAKHLSWMQVGGRATITAAEADALLVRLSVLVGETSESVEQG